MTKHPPKGYPYVRMRSELAVAVLAALLSACGPDKATEDSTVQSAPTITPFAETPKGPIETAVADCEGGNLPRCLLLGKAFLGSEGDKVPKDPERARAVLMKACNGGIAEACHVLAVLLSAYEPTCEVDVGTRSVACSVKEGPYDGPAGMRNEEKALEHFAQACDGGFGLACGALAARHAQGAAGARKDQARAGSLLDRGCELREKFACLRRGSELEHARHRGDLVRAAAMYLRACEEGSDVGCMWIAELHVGGRGVRQDLGRAAELHERACTLAKDAACSRAAELRREIKVANAIDAMDVWRAYDANEVAADNAFKGKTVVVRGVIANISKDIADDVIVHLRSPNDVMPTSAYVRESEKGKAAGLTKRQGVLLTCTGAGLVLVPVLRDCVIE